MTEEFLNDRSYLVDIPRYSLRVPSGQQFYVPDDDAWSLANDFPTVGAPTTELFTQDGNPLTLQDGTSYLLYA